MGCRSTNLALTGLPALVAAAWLAGLERESVLALLVLLSSSAFMASLAILASAQREQAGTARAQATAWIFGWLLGPPVVVDHAHHDRVALGRFAGRAEEGSAPSSPPSSPLSLLTDHRLVFRTSALSLEGRVALMIGLQALFGLLAVAFAAGRLKAREKNPNWVDPTRGYRPPCGDDPDLLARVRAADPPGRRAAPRPPPA